MGCCGSSEESAPLVRAGVLGSGVTLQSHHGFFLVAKDGDDTLTAHRDHHGHQGHFHIELHGHHVRIRTHAGLYVHADMRNRVHVNNLRNENENWTLEQHGQHIALRSHHGGYLGVDASGNVTLLPLPYPDHDQKFIQRVA